MITTIFWDLGGVLLSNGWDRAARRRACERFDLDRDDFEDRHEHVVDEFETARLDLDGYLERTVFFEPRAFTRADFKAFMFAQSREDPETLAVVRGLRHAARYRLAVINNESLELNAYRIETFGLRECFPLFFSSCFVGLRKPDAAIYRLALGVTQTPAADALLVDDRAINVEAARGLGMQTIHYRTREQLLALFRGSWRARTDQRGAPQTASLASRGFWTTPPASSSTSGAARSWSQELDSSGQDSAVQDVWDDQCHSLPSNRRSSSFSAPPAT